MKQQQDDSESMHNHQFQNKKNEEVSWKSKVGAQLPTSKAAVADSLTLVPREVNDVYAVRRRSAPSLGRESAESIVVMKSGRYNRTPNICCLTWLKQKKMKTKNERLLKHSKSASQLLDFPRRNSSTSKPKRRQSLFDELRETGVQEEEASYRQHLYDMMRYAAGDLDLGKDER